MHEERKKILRYALEQDISDVHTYSGYKGDLIVKITTKDATAVQQIRKFALSLDVKDVVVKQNPYIVEFEIYCITPDDNVYELKVDDDDSEKHRHYVEDNWTKTALN